MKITFKLLLFLIFSTYVTPNFAKPIGTNSASAKKEIISHPIPVSSKKISKKKEGFIQRLVGHSLIKKWKKKLKKSTSHSSKNDEATIDSMATVSLLSALFGLLIFTLSGGAILGFLFSLAGIITGIITGIIALKRIKRNPTEEKGKGLAIAGIVVGALFIVGLVAITVAIIG